MESALEVLSNAATLVREQEETAGRNVLARELPLLSESEERMVTVIGTPPDLQTPAISEVSPGGELRRDYPSAKLKSPSAAFTNARQAGRQANSPLRRPAPGNARPPREHVASECTPYSRSVQASDFNETPVRLSGLKARKLNFNSQTSAESAVEDHFRRSLQKINLPQVLTGSDHRESLNQVCRQDPVDDHFARALGKAWLDLKAASNVSS